MKTPVRSIIVIMLLICGAILCGKGTWIHVKGMLAQALLQQAWEQTLVRRKPVKPWPWADTWPIARLQSKKYGQNMVVLAGQKGATLAFGPGMLQTGSKPGQPGTCILAGHRDTSFKFLQQVQPGDIFIVEDTQGVQWQYKVSSTAVWKAEDLYIKQLPVPTLALITCYPFNAVLPGTSQRYVVLAEKV